MNNKRLTERLVGTKAPNICLPSLHARVCLSDFTGRRQVILYFMPRFTSSAAWRGAMALGRLQDALRKKNTVVLLIGRGGYLRPATRLAAELGLPFTILADEEGTAACRYGLDERSLGTTAVATFLVGRWGTIRHADVARLPGAGFAAAALMRALGRLRDQAPMTQPARWLYDPIELAACGC